jgi:hypothetical protein
MTVPAPRTLRLRRFFPPGRTTARHWMTADLHWLLAATTPSNSWFIMPGIEQWPAGTIKKSSWLTSLGLDAGFPTRRAALAALALALHQHDPSAR